MQTRKRPSAHSSRIKVKDPGTAKKKKKKRVNTMTRSVVHTVCRWFVVWNWDTASEFVKPSAGEINIISSATLKVQ